jgi:hypothetical protein
MSAPDGEAGARPPSGIGTLAEKSLHAALKAWYARPGDQLEVPVAGIAADGRRYRYHIDLVRPADAPDAPPLFIEIQTRNFNSLKRKLVALTEAHRVHLVYPVAAERWLVDCAADGSVLRRRRSPKRGRVENAFDELVRLPDLICRPTFSFEVLLIRDEEVRLDDGRGSWRRGRRSIADRRLLDVLDARVFHNAEDFAALLPDGLPAQFTARELAALGHLSPVTAGRMAYCLWKMGALMRAGKRGNAYVYAAPAQRA